MHPGMVVADTKSYLYLDPTRFLARAASLWDSKIGLGTLSHQTIGYLFPMGPWYWVTQRVLGIPTWISQRLWLGIIIFAAGTGAWRLSREFGVRRRGAAISMLAYAFSPYVLGYSSFYSLLLGPWAALPWWIIWTMRGLRVRGWVYPALIAISVQLVGSLNASSLILCLIGPALWIPFSVIGTREATWRDAWSFLWRTGLLTTVTSLWWLSALLVEGRYGVNILRLTESVRTVAATSTPFEIIRGLGYWFIYGGDRTGSWNDARGALTQTSLGLFATFLVPTIALAGAALIKWRTRAYFVLLVAVGLIIGVGPAPYDHPSLFSAAFKWFTLSTSTGFALRNVNRAIPLLILALAALIGAGVDVVSRRIEQRGRPLIALGAFGLVAVICITAAIPALSGGYYSRYLEREGAIPGYWTKAIERLSSGDPQTRVLALPGSDFASYRWGDTRDPIEPGLMDRPYVAREIVPWGSEQSLSFLQALDRRVQDGSLDPDGLAETLKLMGVGDVILRLDLRTDRWNLIPAGALWKKLTDKQPAGLGAPERFGGEIPGNLRFVELGDLTKPNAETPNPPPVAIMKVNDPTPIIRAKSAEAPILIAGDSEAIMDLSAASLLDSNRVVFFSSSFEKKRDEMRSLPKSTLLVLSDTNRRRGQRWGVLHDQFGYTEQAGEKPLVTDPTDQRLLAFPDETDASRTVAVLTGVESVRATSYGTPAFGFVPGERPASAFDGDPFTAWVVDSGVPVSHQKIQVVLTKPVTTSSINLMQTTPVAAYSEKKRYRAITRIRLTFDGEDSIERNIGRPSRKTKGQILEFKERTFQKLEVTILDSSGKEIREGVRRNGVGFAEIRIPTGVADKTVRIHEVIRMPEQMLKTLGAESTAHPLIISITRDSTMDNTKLNRSFRLPEARTFTLSGTALLSPYAKGQDIDTALGAPSTGPDSYTAISSSRYDSSTTRAGAATDGDPKTAWVSQLGNPKAELKVTFKQQRSINNLDLQIVADGRHSIPTVISMRADKGPKRIIKLPPIPDRVSGGVVSVPITFESISGKAMKLTIRKYRSVKLAQIVMPSAFAELGMEGTTRSYSQVLANNCTEELITLDGEPLPVRISGSAKDALQGEDLSLEPCNGDISLSAGPHELHVSESPRNPTGFDINRLIFSSGAGGTAIKASELRSSPAGLDASPASLVRAQPAPTVTVKGETRSSSSIAVAGATRPFWLVLGQSLNEGWHATINGKDLGAPVLVDGYANGWYIDTDGETNINIDLVWRPQGTIKAALWISLFASLLCLGIIVTSTIRRRRSTDPNKYLGQLESPSLREIRVREVSIPSRRRIILALAMTVGTGAVIAPWVGIIVGIASWYASGGKRVRTLIRFAPPLLLTSVAFGIPIIQGVKRFPPFFDWVTHFQWASWVVWLAISALVLDVLISVISGEEEIATTDQATALSEPETAVQILEPANE